MLSHAFFQFFWLLFIGLMGLLGLAAALACGLLCGIAHMSYREATPRR